MPPKKKHPVIAFINILIFSSVILFHTSAIFDISIKTATPLLVLPLLSAYCMFSPMHKSALAGLICGVCLDSVATKSYCFNTIILFVLAVGITLFSNTVFNKNVRSATALALIASVIYFVSLWLFFRYFGVSVTDRIDYLLSYALPSAVYSTVFVIPLYYLYRHFDKIRSIN